MTGTALPTETEDVPEEFVIFQALSDTEKQWAEGAAMYGPGGSYNDLRKSYLAVRYLQLRDEAAAKNEKVTDALNNERAHADDEYGSWLDSRLSDHAAWRLLDAQRTTMVMRLQFIQSSNYNRNRMGA